MNARSLVLSLPVLATLALVATAQPPAFAPPPARGPSPLLFLRFLGPAGMHVTFHPGTRAARSFEAPATAGVRVGYLIRVMLDGPGIEPLFPTIEVRGGLWLGAKLNCADYPAPVVLTAADLERIRAGSLVTKVIYLENPDRAAPVATLPDAPLETDVAADRDLLAEARELGRPIAVVRFGGRTVPADELARYVVPGTVLLPGEKGLAHAALPPCLPLADRRFLDPIAGPRPPEEECLRDGGDRGLRAAIDADGRLRGVEPEDTVAEYTDARGRRHVVCSNRVCVCVPRFAVLRSETPFGQHDHVVTVNDTRAIHAQEQVKSRVPSLLAGQVEQLKAVKGRERPSIWLTEIGVAVAARVEVLQANQVDWGPAVALGAEAVRQLRERDRLVLLKQLEWALELSRVEGVKEYDQTAGTAVAARVQGGPEVLKATVVTRDFTVCCGEPSVPEGPLVLFKCADRPAAKVGDVVTFTLRYANHGGRPLTDVAVSDSLTGRLEYVPGSAKADRDAVFTLQENEAGSVLLRWEIGGIVQPGQGGVVRFQARIR